VSEISFTTKRVKQFAERIGQERVDERESDTRRWEKLPLVEKLAAPWGVKPPPAARVTYDGGRMQRCDLPPDAKSHDCEPKVGALLEWQSSRNERNPCPELPDTFENLARVKTLTREIHRVAGERAAPRGEVFRRADADPAPDELPPPDALAEVRDAVVTFKPPEVESREVLASRASSPRFGKQLAARAWSLGFAAAPVKAFVADGGSANWGIWEAHFKHLKIVPILDSIHALTYVYSAALAGRSKAAGGVVYLRWISWVWEDEVSRVSHAFRPELGGTL
jgi:hypothetical protein